MVKSEKFGHLHVVYHFTIPLITFVRFCQEFSGVLFELVVMLFQLLIYIKE